MAEDAEAVEVSDLCELYGFDTMWKCIEHVEYNDVEETEIGKTESLPGSALCPTPTNKIS